MRAQSGCFLVGGLIRRYGGENLTVGDEFLPAGRWQQITTLRVYFPLPGAKKQTSTRWPAVGWSIRIPAAWKPGLRRALASEASTVITCILTLTGAGDWEHTWLGTRLAEAG